MGRIVVGFDGSEVAHAALRWGAEAASLRGDDLAVLACWREPIFEGRPWIELHRDSDGVRRTAEADLDAALYVIAGRHPGVAVSRTLLGDQPAEALVAASLDATMIVVGASDRRAFSSVLLGSVSRQVAGHAHCTVVVVRDGGRPEGDVVVGVDGSASGRRALAWAAGEARGRGVGLHAVLAWSHLRPEGDAGPVPFREDYDDDDARTALRRIVEDVLGPEPGVAVERTASCELAAKALLERSADASLVVVAPHRTSMRHRVDLGSVTVQLLHHAPCPVAVVRSDAT